MHAVGSVSWFAISNVWICTVVWRRTRMICGLADGTAGNLAACYCPLTPLCWLIFCSAALCIYHTFRHPAARFPIWCTCCRGFENQLTALPPSRRILRRKRRKKVNNDNRQRVHENKRWTFATATTRRRHAVTNATAIAAAVDGQWNSKSSVWKHCHRAVVCWSCVRYASAAAGIGIIINIWFNELQARANCLLFFFPILRYRNYKRVSFC